MLHASAPTLSHMMLRQTDVTAGGVDGSVAIEVCVDCLLTLTTLLTAGAKGGFAPSPPPRAFGLPHSDNFDHLGGSRRAPKGFLQRPADVLVSVADSCHRDIMQRLADVLVSVADSCRGPVQPSGRRPTSSSIRPAPGRPCPLPSAPPAHPHHRHVCCVRVYVCVCVCVCVAVCCCVAVCVCCVFV